jgi:hypothetical protein
MSKDNQDEETTIAREEVRKRMLEEAKRIRVRKPEGKYQFDNPHLEYKNEWQQKNDDLEKKYDQKH